MNQNPPASFFVDFPFPDDSNFNLKLWKTSSIFFPLRAPIHSFSLQFFPPLLLAYKKDTHFLLSSEKVTRVSYDYTRHLIHVKMGILGLCLSRKWATLNVNLQPATGLSNQIPTGYESLKHSFICKLFIHFLSLPTL